MCPNKPKNYNFPYTGLVATEEDEESYDSIVAEIILECEKADPNRKVHCISKAIIRRRNCTEF